MTQDTPEPDWKFKLRYGKITTQFQHYTTISEGVAGNLGGGFSCPPGPAFMAMKAWASSSEEAAHMARSFGSHIGFTVTGRIHIYTTDPEQPPKENPFGYDINFTPFTEEKA